MKTLTGTAISSFGGLNFVLEELNNLKINNIIENHLPVLVHQSKYTWTDIIYSYWSVIFCGGDCAEDIHTNFKHSFRNNPLLKLPSADRILDRIKSLAEPVNEFKTERGKTLNKFSINENINDLNLKILNRIRRFDNQSVVLDYDNTFVFAQKADSQMTYLKEYGYCPGVGIIGSDIVFIENRNGNSPAHVLQAETFERMFSILKKHNIKVNIFRADSATYQFDTIDVITKHTDEFYIKARRNEPIAEAIKSITEWTEIHTNGKIMYRGSTDYTPFIRTANRAGKLDELKTYRLVVTKEAKHDGQLDLFTGEACVYSCILTNNFDKSEDEVVYFYNQRGKQEREFDILKNDFAWNKMPFSRIEENTVFLILMAICRNLYNYLIEHFSKVTNLLSPTYRLKKFIFRFICIPAKWIKTSGVYKLRIYGTLRC
jgi:hypothetical protein